MRSVSSTGAALACLTLAIGCGGNGGGGGGAPPPAMGQVQVEITDAAFPYSAVKQVNLQISNVELRREDATLLSLFPPSQTVDMMRLRDGRTSQIASDNFVPPGRYTSILVTIPNAAIVYENDAQLAQPQATIFEAPLDPVLVVAEGSSTTILVDLDLGRSFTFVGPPGGARNFIFAPQGRAVVRGTQEGAIEGKFVDAAQAPIGSAEVQLSASGVPLASTKTETDGAFAFLEISPGTYTITGFSPSGIALVTTSVTVQERTPTSITLTSSAVVPGGR